MKPVSKTAYYCCGCRMHDAESENPVVGDYYARQLLGDQGMIYWEDFKNFTFPRASNIARHYIVETILRKQLYNDPKATIIQVGAGLDTRAFRMYGGSWVEVDAPEVINYKESIIPSVECKNNLQRIPINFEKEQLSEKLHSFVGRKNVIVVVEGVWFYLSKEERNILLNTLATLFPTHKLICDLMNKYFFEKLAAKGIHQKLQEHGTTFVDVLEYPEETMINFGYEQIEKKSMIKTAGSLGLNGVWKSAMMRLMPGNLANGYMVHLFQFDKHSSH